MRDVRAPLLRYLLVLISVCFVVGAFSRRGCEASAAFDVVVGSLHRSSHHRRE